MESIRTFSLFCFFLCFLLLAKKEVVSANLGPTKLFVFGDSLADTGNSKINASCWKEPYGITCPGKPSGRFSDGCILPDYIAQSMGIDSPTPYKMMKPGVEAKEAKYGINFAVGGTGIFATGDGGPNMTTQIDLFQKIINKYTSTDIQSSVVLLSVNGNDYNGVNCSSECTKNLNTKVVEQIVQNLKRLHSLGVKKIGVTKLSPLGCIPMRSISLSFKGCNQTDNAGVRGHNLLLHQAIKKLNDENRDATFVTINLYKAFMKVFAQGRARFDNPLKPCCVGTNGTGGDLSCGNTNIGGEKKYTICQNPKSAFFWDGYHPTQEGWKAVYPHLQSDLKKLSISNLFNRKCKIINAVI